MSRRTVMACPPPKLLPHTAIRVGSTSERLSAVLTGPRVSLFQADLSGRDLSGADLRRANLNDAHGTEVDLSHATLSSVDTVGLYLSGVDLTGADLAGTPFTQGSRAAAAEVRGITGTPLNLAPGLAIGPASCWGPT